MRPTSCISSKWPKNSMQFTLGMPFLAVLGKFYRNLKGLKSSIVNQKSSFPVLSFPVYFWTGLCFPNHFPDATHFKGNTQCYRIITCCLVMRDLYSRPLLGLPVCRWVRPDREHQCHPEHQEHPRIQCLLGHPDQNTVMQRVSKHSSDHTTMITA